MSNLNTLYHKPELILSGQRKVLGEVTWQSPSNIALVKYWGKHGNQLPMNPSLSFTLNNSYTETTVKYRNSENGFKFSFFLEGKHKAGFEKKLNIFFDKIKEIFPFLKQLELGIFSKNTFPHSSGIASSASGMSALSLCLCSIEKKLFDLKYNEDEFLRKASYISRIGSGSASRSVYGKLASWGKSKLLQSSSDYFSSDLSTILHPSFLNYQDSIILISKGEKEVSSSAGHSLMNNHPFASARFAQANSNFIKIVEVLNNGNLDEFQAIVENEALSLHALMMSSSPGYFLIEPDTLKAIKSIVLFRKRTKLPICFTLDAGPNIHLLYPESYKTQVREFIEKELLNLDSRIEVIYDSIGKGPIMIKES